MLRLWSQILGSFKAMFFKEVLVFHRPVYIIDYMNATKNVYLLLICLCSWCLLLFSGLLHKILLFRIFQLEVSLLCRPKLIWLEFSNNLQLPKMPGKFQHDQFLVDKFGNIMLTYIIFLVFIFIITRFSLIYLPSFPDCMIV